jgi:hypothetical protein
MEEEKTPGIVGTIVHLFVAWLPFCVLLTGSIWVLCGILLSLDRRADAPWMKEPMLEQLDLFSNQMLRTHESSPALPVPDSSEGALRAADPGSAPHARDALRCALESRTKLKIQLRITDNTSTLMSVRYTQGGAGAALNLHHMFLDTPPGVLHALARWVINPKAKKSGSVLNTFIKERSQKIRPSARRAVHVRTVGRHFDLKSLFDEVNLGHLGGEIDAAITWGKMPRQRRRRSIRFGSYTPGEHVIRLHPLLDQPFVPRYFVRYIVFHEMLHAKLGIEESPSGRRVIHSAEFNRLEGAYPDYAKAIAWMETESNLNRLLNSRKCA